MLVSSRIDNCVEPDKTAVAQSVVFVRVDVVDVVAGDPAMEVMLMVPKMLFVMVGVFCSCGFFLGSCFVLPKNERNEFRIQQQESC